eukprot:14545489-Alexandrium_andersonii.AAC.1
MSHVPSAPGAPRDLGKERVPRFGHMKLVVVQRASHSSSQPWCNQWSHRLAVPNRTHVSKGSCFRCNGSFVPRSSRG